MLSPAIPAIFATATAPTLVRCAPVNSQFSMLTEFAPPTVRFTCGLLVFLVLLSMNLQFVISMPFAAIAEPPIAGTSLYSNVQLSTLNVAPSRLRAARQ